MRDYDFIATSKPVNRTASDVLKGGDDFDFSQNRNNHEIHVQRTPFKTKEFTGHPEHNLTGEIFGRLKVIGYCGKTNPNQPHGRWLVRCSCGNYERRKAKSLKSGDGSCGKSMCFSCDRKESYRRGKR